MTSRCKRIRKSFAKIPSIVELPNLIETQKMSYARFLQADIRHEDREDVGLQGAFKSVFPIYDFNETSSLNLFHISWVLPHMMCWSVCRRA